MEICRASTPQGGVSLHTGEFRFEIHLVARAAKGHGMRRTVHHVFLFAQVGQICQQLTSPVRKSQAAHGRSTEEAEETAQPSRWPRMFRQSRPRSSSTKVTGL